MIRINLLPVRAAQQKEKLRSQILVLLLCIVLVGVGCGALYVNKMMEIDGIKAEIADIDRQNKALKEKLGEVANYEKKKKELEQKLAVLAELKAGKSGPVHLLDELSRALPDKVWLLDFSESGGNVSLTGIGDSEKTVASFMNNLERSPYYQGVELGVTEQKAVGGIKMQQFSLKCRTQKPSPQ